MNAERKNSTQIIYIQSESSRTFSVLKRVAGEREEALLGRNSCFVRLGESVSEREHRVIVY
jgi:hypothetical protein